ncbi:MAG: ERCC4 domain-containing protein [Tepidanaerobacteraceae bacterium]|nr:ERCC4 domain-containing protein [Tepidanaerobacteraceae bacterium]
MSLLLWILESVENDKFPYRLTIQNDGKEVLCLRVQSRWPGAGSQIFCLRESEDYSDPVEEIERVPIISLNRYGKRLSVVLDRPANKRCEFLFLKKKYKTKEGEYEQIFWRTQQGLKERKPRVKLTARGDSQIHVLIDTNEKYPWKFQECVVERKALPAGDYALLRDDGIFAVVERKTFENLISDFNDIAILHQKLGELEAYKHSAMVVEANYSDFLNTGKLTAYTPSYAAKVLAELSALHPGTKIVFAGNRKLANEWTLRFFQAIESHERDTLPDKIAEKAASYGASPGFKGGVYYDIRKYILDESHDELTVAELKDKFPDAPESTIKRVLRDLKNKGLITIMGRGRKSRWIKV